MTEKKNIPKLRFPEFSQDWVQKSLENLFIFKNGLNKEKDFFGKGTPIINFTDVFKKTALTNDNIAGLVDVNEKEINNFSTQKGDVFFTRTSETIDDIGMAAVLTENIKNCVFSGFVLRARPKGNELDDGFKKYCFSIESVREEIVKKSSFTTRALTSGTLLNKVVISYPISLPEQTKIANFLTSVDEKIQALKEKKRLLKEYKKGLMQKIFSQEIRFKQDDGSDFGEWEDENFKNMFTIGSGKDYKHLKNGDVPVFGTGGYMTSVDKYLYDGETVCIGRKGTIDKPMYYKGKIWTVDTLFYTHTFQEVIPKFVFYIFNTVNWKEYNEASGVPSLSKSTIEKIQTNVPPLPEQKKIVNFLTAIDEKVEKISRQIEEAQTFKKGLLQQMFV